MARVGLNAASGRLLLGWHHCVQSIGTILTTEIGERLQRRLFGSHTMRVIDRPQNMDTIIDIYATIAEALEPRVVEGRQYGEPGFVLVRVSVDAGEMGKVKLLLSGVYFENGHLGDFSNPVEQQIAYAVTETAGGISVEVV